MCCVMFAQRRQAWIFLWPTTASDNHILLVRSRKADRRHRSTCSADEREIGSRARLDIRPHQVHDFAFNPLAWEVLLYHRRKLPSFERRWGVQMVVQSS